MSLHQLIRKLASFILFVLGSLSLLSGVCMAAPLGQPAPDFELRGEGAAPVKLSALRGKVVYLDFWASWCGPCRQSFPWMNELQAKFAARGLQVVAVNLDAKDADAKKFLAETAGKFQIAYDSKGLTPKLYGVKGMPTSYLIDREGRLVYEHAGFNLSKTADLEKQIDKLLDTK